MEDKRPVPLAVVPTPRRAGSHSTASAADARAMRRCAAGDGAGLAALHGRYGGQCHALAQRVVGDGTAAEAVVAAAFTQLWRQAGRYDGRRITPRAWLVSLTLQTAIDHLREGSGQALHAVMVGRVLHALDLPHDEAVAVALIGGLTADEISRVQRTVPSQRRSQSTRAPGASGEIRSGHVAHWLQPCRDPDQRQ